MHVTLIQIIQKSLVVKTTVSAKQRHPLAVLFNHAIMRVSAPKASMDGENTTPVCVDCSHLPHLARADSASSPLSRDQGSGYLYEDYRKTSGSSDQIPLQLSLMKHTK
jgi:hypothetical protein